MSALTIKRIAVWVVSMGLGLLTGYVIITVGFDLLPLFSSVSTPQGVTIDEYGILYFLFTAVPIGFVYLIWIDHFVDSRILPD